MIQTPLWSGHAVLRAVRGEGLGDWVAEGVSIDSRTLTPGDLFVALSGPNFDGHDFVPAAFEKGAAAALVSRRPEDLPHSARLVVVEDTLAALTGLGAAGRQRSAARVVAVTGSSGKTSTKEALRLALAEPGPAFASGASHNNHWGVPLSLSLLPRDARWGVFEIGMNHAGEIRPLVQLVRPHAVVITNIGVAHLENLGSREAIADAKSEIFLGLEPDGVAVLPRDDDYFDRLLSNARAAGAPTVVSYGRHRRADVRLLDQRSDPEGSDLRVDVLGRVLAVRIGAPGAHWAHNALAVLATVAALDADLAAASAALAQVRALKGRGARERIAVTDGQLTLIDESYNANPYSMQAALSVLGQVRPGLTGRRIAVLGDMLELGEQGPALHADLAPHVVEAGADAAFLCGPQMASLATALQGRVEVVHAADSTVLAPLVSEEVRAGDVVLVKGSFGSRMRLVVDALRSLDRGQARGEAGHAL